MRYALLVCADEKAVLSDHERSRRVAAAASFERQMQARGVLLAGVPLHPTETAATVRCWDGGDLEIADAPFAETREQVAGFYLLECAGLDEAIEVAAKVPAAGYGSIEVRPVSGS